MASARPPQNTAQSVHAPMVLACFHQPLPKIAREIPETAHHYREQRLGPGADRAGARCSDKFER